MIRKATERDIPYLLRLLSQVLSVHANGRPDIFKANKTKYISQELIALLKDENKPIFVSTSDIDEILGYAFCELVETKNDNILQDCKYLYIDDLCVDENNRGKGIGKALYLFVSDYAKQIGCKEIRLNVWALNESAIRFYQKCGFTPLKTLMQKEI